METKTICWVLYFIGAVIAFLLGTYQAYKEERNNIDVSEYGVMIIPITFLSWLYIILYIKYFCLKNDNRIYSK